jgi:hypothetical protein
MALSLADHGYVLETGRIVLEGKADVLAQNSDVKEFYLGLNEVGSRKSIARGQALQPPQALAVLKKRGCSYSLV